MQEEERGRTPCIRSDEHTMQVESELSSTPTRANTSSSNSGTPRTTLRIPFISPRGQPRRQHFLSSPAIGQPVQPVRPRPTSYSPSAPFARLGISTGTASDDEFSVSETVSDHSSSSQTSSDTQTPSFLAHSGPLSGVGISVALAPLSGSDSSIRPTKKRELLDEDDEETTDTLSSRKKHKKDANFLSRSCSSLPLLPERRKVLPCKPGNTEFNTVDSSTVKDLLEGRLGAGYEYQIIDCRFEYEYEGGHIRGAKNIPVPGGVLPEFFDKVPNLELNSKKIIIFHCEFSSKRAPETLRALRRIDRTRNGANWPDLYYPELYLLEGGYSAFYSLFPEYCDPQGYVKMKEDHQSNKDGHLARRNSVQDLSADFGELRTRRRSPRNLRGSSSGSPMRSRAASPRFLDRLMEEEEADRNTTNNNNNQITVEEKREGVVPFTLKIPIMRTKQ